MLEEREIRVCGKGVIDDVYVDHFWLKATKYVVLLNHCSLIQSVLEMTRKEAIVGLILSGAQKSCRC